MEWCRRSDAYLLYPPIHLFIEEARRGKKRCMKRRIEGVYLRWYTERHRQCTRSAAYLSISCGMKERRKRKEVYEEENRKIYLRWYTERHNPHAQWRCAHAVLRISCILLPLHSPRNLPNIRVCLCGMFVFSPSPFPFLSLPFLLSLPLRFPSTFLSVFLLVSCAIIPVIKKH